MHSIDASWGTINVSGRPPANQLETITNPDGSITQRLKRNSGPGKLDKASSNNIESDSNVNPAAIAINHPMRQVSVRLNQLGLACEKFSWTPRTEREYGDLQEFSDVTRQALRFTLEYRNDRIEKDQIKKIEEQGKLWEKSLSSNLEKRLREDPDAISTMNKFAETAMAKTRQHVPFVGKVLISGIEYPDHVLLEIVNTPIVVNIPHSPDGPPMLPDSQWLCFVETPPTKKTVEFGVNGRTLTTQSARLLFAVGPLGDALRD